MVLNSKQKVILNFTIVLLMIIVLFPNWQYVSIINYEPEITEVKNLGHYFLFITPPLLESKRLVVQEIRVDLFRIFLCTSFLILISGLLFYRLKDSNSAWKFNFMSIFGCIILCLGGVAFIYITNSLANLDFEATTGFVVGMYLLPTIITLSGWLMVYKFKSKDTTS